MFLKKRSNIIKNAPKIGSERPTNPFWSQMAPRAEKVSQKSHGDHFLDLLLGGPNQSKSMKNRSTFSTRFLVDLSSVSGTVLGVFCLHFHHLFGSLFRNSDFMKNSVSPIRNHHFQGLEAPEIDQKSTENRHRVSDAFFVTF